MTKDLLVKLIGSAREQEGRYGLFKIVFGRENARLAVRARPNEGHLS
jgi:hypothetical protein